MFMVRPRIIPCLLISEERLIKTVRFSEDNYIGDPLNAVRIFNNLEVDELIVLDVSATVAGKSPDMRFIRKIAGECFMPLTYGGAVSSISQIEEILSIGVEKVAINSFAFEYSALVNDASKLFGSQCIVAGIDVRTGKDGKYCVYSQRGKKDSGQCPVGWAKAMENDGAGEILLTSIDRDGTWSGYDLELIKKVSDSVTIPVIANGGAGSIEDLRTALTYGLASAAAAGSMFVYQKKGCGVLISYPDSDCIENLCTNHD